MKKIVSIFFLTLYLFGAFEMSQLLKLPVLIEHFKHHQSEDKSLSFIDFLTAHYAKGDVLDQDRKDDMKLPFKHQNDFSVSLIAVEEPVVTNLHLKSFASSVNKIKAYSDNSMLPSPFSGSIWQPPKFS